MSFKSSLKRLATAASIAALTVSVSFAAPAQKANAQLVGAGESTIAPLVNNFNQGVSYEVTNSGNGRLRFEAGEIDFVGATKRLLPNVSDQIVVNPIDTNLAAPYNVPGFNGVLTTQQACLIINGNITDWSEVGGPDLPIRRVVREDFSGANDIHDAGFTVPFCGFTIYGLNGETIIPNPNGYDIQANSNQNLIDIVASNPGAIGYADTVSALEAGLSIVINAETGLSTIAAGSTYVVFRSFYDTEEKAAAARDLCTYIATEGSAFAQSIGYAPPTRESDSCDAITGPGQQGGSQQP